MLDSGIYELVLGAHIFAIACVIGGSLARYLMTNPDFGADPERTDAIGMAMVRTVLLPAAWLAVGTGLVLFMNKVGIIKDAGGKPDGLMHLKATLGLVIALIVTGELFLLRKAIRLRGEGDVETANRKAASARRHSLFTALLGVVAVIVVMAIKYRATQPVAPPATSQRAVPVETESFASCGAPKTVGQTGQCLVAGPKKGGQVQ
ncbi:MAG: hypothetical protein CMH54_12275 [Myxococcales bacterium]|nr:hypothetical protein [Myxococcales bacterium]|tara:strand:- start:323 stop:937 length:615 start_codon:yes stop_codon:yes gene_type:complete